MPIVHDWWPYFTPEQRLSYHEGIRQGQRRGQSWFNSLNEEDRHILAGTEYDPFAYDDPIRILHAFRYLNEQKARARELESPHEPGVTGDTGVTA